MARAVQQTPTQVTIRDARIIFRNFAGKKGTYNLEGKRNFNVIIPPDLVEPMLAQGWNLKEGKRREENDPIEYRVEVEVRFKPRPPRVVMISSKGRTGIPEEDIYMLDFVDMAKVDLILNPYVWSNAMGEGGVKAYCKSLFITILEDELELEYADIPEIGHGAVKEIESHMPLQIEAGDILDGEVIEDSEEEL